MRHITRNPRVEFDRPIVLVRSIFTAMLQLVLFALAVGKPVAAPTGEAGTTARRPTSNLTVDLDYAVYTGVINNATGLNVWKGYVDSAIQAPNLRTHADSAVAFGSRRRQRETFAGRLRKHRQRIEPWCSQIRMDRTAHNRSQPCRTRHFFQAMKIVCS